MNKTLYANGIICFSIIILMVAASMVFESREIILPEIAALAAGCLLYQNPSWLSRPLHIFLLPSITAVLGFLVNLLDLRLALKLILILALMLLVLRLFRSTLAPAFATGLLPVITDATSSSFIISALFFTAALALYLVLALREKTDFILKRENSRDGLIFMLFVAVWIVICDQEKWMFMAALPPVIVTGYEAAHKEAYGGTTFWKHAVCLFLASFVGIQSLHFLDNLLLAVLADMAAVYLILRAFKCRLPPAYAMAILPMVLYDASYRYFYFQVLLMSIVILGGVWLYKNSILRKILSVFSSRRNL